MAKLKLYIAFVCILFITACISKQKKDINNQFVNSVSPFDSKEGNMKVKDLQVATKLDTISYALGIVWAKNINKFRSGKVTLAFYLGVFNYMKENKSLMDSSQAQEYLDKRSEQFKIETSWPVIDNNIKLNDIKILSKFDTLSYALGYEWYRVAKKFGIENVSCVLLLGLTKGLNGDSSLFNYNKADKYLKGYVEEKRDIKYAFSKRINKLWLINNKDQNNVISLKSGLQYKIIKNGHGRTPTLRDVAECNYTGRLIDGTVFKSSYEDVPLKLYLFGYIKGWTEALLLMKEGDKWELYIPFNLAFGSRGSKEVPPFSTVIYELELIKIYKK